MKKVMTLMLLMVITLLAAVIIEAPVTDAATDDTTQTDSVVTGAGVTIATVTLTDQHWYSDTTDMSVVCVTDGDVTAGATVAANRMAVNLTGLTAATTQDCVTTHLTEIDDSMTSIGLKIIPFLVIMAGFAGAIGSVAMGVMGIMGRTSGSTTVIQGFLVLFIGVIMVPIVLSFQSQAVALYAIAVEYLGVSSIVGLAGIFYILGLIGAAISLFAPQLRGFAGSD